MEKIIWGIGNGAYMGPLSPFSALKFDFQRCCRVLTLLNPFDMVIFLDSAEFSIIYSRIVINRNRPNTQAWAWFMGPSRQASKGPHYTQKIVCLLYTSDAADE